MTEEMLAQIINCYKQNDEKSIEFKWLFLQELYNNPQDFALLCIPEGKREAYIEWLEPKLSNFMKKYDETRGSALHYFRYVFKLAYKTYLHNEQRKNIKKEFVEFYYQKENLFSTFDFSEEIIQEEKKERLKIEDYYMNDRPSKKYRLWLIILALKCAPNLTETHIRKVSLYSGIKEKIINDYILQTTITCEKRIQKINYLQAINNSYFIKNNMLQKKLLNYTIEKTSYFYQKTKEELDKNTKRTSNLSKRFSSIKNVVSNKRIAEILNIRKSVVDYCIAHLLYDNPTGFFESVSDRINYDYISSNRKQTQKTGSF